MNPSRNRLVFGLVTLAALSSARPAENNEADYVDEPAPPKKPARPLTSRRNPLAGRTNGKTATSTTTTTTPPPEEEAVEEEYDEELPEQEPQPTTEAPKKNFLKGGVVRPFRSNDELLATLKRRREQAVNNKVQKPAQASKEEEPASAPVEKETPKKSTSSGRRNRFNAKDKNTEQAAEESPSSVPSRTGRRFNGRR